MNKDFSPIADMTTDEIKHRLKSLQDEINELVDLLPDGVQVSFGTRFHTTPADVMRHKKLVMTLREPKPQ